MAWTKEVNPFGDNRTPALIGVSAIDGVTIVPVAVDPATGAILTEGSSASSVNATVYQGTNPWTVTGTVSIGSGGAGVTTVYQGGAPWLVNASIIGQPVVTATVAGPVKIWDGTFIAAVVAGATRNGLVTGTADAVLNVGQQTVNTTAVQIKNTSTVATNGILVGALSSNSASIFIGSSGVTTSNGAELTPGSSLPFTCNLNLLYIISAGSTTDKIWYNVA